MNLEELLAAMGYGAEGMAPPDYSSAVAQGQTATADPQRAGIASGMNPRVLASLADTNTNPETNRTLYPDAANAPYRPDTGADTSLGRNAYLPVPSRMPVMPQQDQPATAPQAQAAQYAPPPISLAPQMAPQQAPMAPQPSPAMPQAGGSPYAPLGNSSDLYAKLMQTMLGDVGDQQKNRSSDALLRFGLATMAAGGKPMSTTLGAVGEGGLAALQGMDEGRAQQLKALLGGASISNTLGEAALRNMRTAPPGAMPSLVGGPGGAAPVLSGSGVSPNAPKGPLSPGQIKGLTTSAFPDDPKAAEDAAAIILAESRGDPHAKKEDSVENSYGLTQINADAWGPIAKTALGNPEQAVKIMRSIYDQRGGSFNDWSTYKNGVYKRYLPDVQKADAEPLQLSGGSGGAVVPARAGGTYGAPSAPASSSSLGSPVAMDPDVAAAQAEYFGRIGNAAAAEIYKKHAMPPEGTQFVRGPDGKVYAQPVGIHGLDYVGAAEAAKDNQKIQITRDGAVYRGGVYIGHAPKEVSAVDAEGNKYPSFTPPMGAVAPGMAHGPGGPGAVVPGVPGAPPIAGQVGTPPPGAVTSTPSELSPGTIERMKKRGSEEEEKRAAVIHTADASVVQQAAFQNMRDAAPNIGAMGPAAPIWQKVAENLRYVVPSGSELGKMIDSQVSSYQDMQKNAGLVLRAVTREVSSREAVQGMIMFEHALPNVTQSPQGFDRTSAQMMGLNDFNIIKAAAQQKWEDDHKGSVAGFEADFRKQLMPVALMYRRLSDSDQAELIQKWKQTDEGKTMLGKIRSQLNYVGANGLYSVVQ